MIRMSQPKPYDRSTLPQGLEHWTQNDWEAKARENPFFAIQAEIDWMDAPAGEFVPGQVEALFARGAVLYRKHIAGLLAGLDDPFVVEYGCGAGRILKALVDAGYRCGGVDIAPTMIDHCRRLVPEALSFALSEPMPDACANVVFSHAVLQHNSTLTAYAAAVAEMCRLLKPGGLLAAHVACEDFNVGEGEAPGRTENFETRSLHYRSGQSAPYREHRQTTWGGVYIGRETLAELLAREGVDIEAWRPHGGAKPRAVWAIGRKRSG